jgi:hypothetical protein
MAVPDFDSAFAVRTLSLQGKVGVFASEADPRTVDTSSFPVGSVCFQTDGTTWKRIGPAASAWVKEEGHQHAHSSPRHQTCPWLQVVRAIQAVSTEVTVLRLIQTMSADITREHEHHHP